MLPKPAAPPHQLCRNKARRANHAIILPMKLSGIQKLTLLDFPGHTAATVFTPGCNFRCPFCHNADLVLGMRREGVSPDEVRPRSPHGAFPSYPTDEFFAFLDKRQKLLDGICITGGEPLLQPGLAEFCEEIRNRGFKVKLDTNGSHPERLRPLIEDGLVDYVAMDVKNAPARYAETVGIPYFDIAPVHESVNLLKEKRVPCEFRTTVVRELHTAEDLREIARWLAEPHGSPASASRPYKGDAPWFLQSFIDAEGVLGGTGRFRAWPPQDLRKILPELQRTLPRTELRGVKET